MPRAREARQHLADVLSLRDSAEITAAMFRTFAHNRTDLYTPLMLDYEYWFRNSIDNPLHLQIKRIHDTVILPRQGAVHPFIPFDPVRELAFRRHVLAPDFYYEHKSMLETVKTAVATQGFIGVKLYSALGYRPIGNKRVDGKRRSLFRRIGKCRFERFTGEEIDEVLDELYRFCAAEQVPITAHILGCGIESYPKASYHFGKPRYWRPVLRAYPDLHLNLAHFAWDLRERYNGPGYAGARPWMNQICDIMDRHRFVYTDSGHHDVVNADMRAEFVKDYREIERDFPGLVPKKLLFGIDWHVVSQVNNFERFKDCYIAMLKDDLDWTDPQTEDFLGGNALHFLGLLPEGTPPEQGWCKNRTRLKAFYAAHGIRPPDWFTSTG